MKYVLFQSNIGYEVLFFLKTTSHASIINSFSLGKPVSAGFVNFTVETDTFGEEKTICDCFGGSDSSGLKSRGEVDSSLLTILVNV